MPAQVRETGVIPIRRIDNRAYSERYSRNLSVGRQVACSPSHSQKRKCLFDIDLLRFDESSIRLVEPLGNVGSYFLDCQRVDKNLDVRSEANKREEHRSAEPDRLGSLEHGVEPTDRFVMEGAGRVIGVEQKVYVRQDHFFFPCNRRVEA